jgi:hypothetical protein
MSSYRKDLKVLAKRFDCKIEHTRGNHLRPVRQGQQSVIAPLTPSNATRTLLNVRAMLQRLDKQAQS